MMTSMTQSSDNPGSDTRPAWLATLYGVLWTLGWALTSAAVVVLYLRLFHPDLVRQQLMYSHGNPSVPRIALTFDDGPSPLWHPLLADTLTRNGAQGTFFVVGYKAARYPEIIARLVRAHHEVASHSWTHAEPNLTIFPEARVAIEIRDTRKVLEQLTGRPVPDFRPPGGGIDYAVIAETLRFHQHIAWWSFNADDAGLDTQSSEAGRIAGQLRDNLRPGAVMLLHGRSHTVAALEAFFATPAARQYTYGTFASVVGE
jgi:peptidoglycan-N-acetylglucosamine deacetylase